jgi:hypothetical protein
MPTETKSRRPSRTRSGPRTSSSRRADTNTTAEDRRYLERHADRLSASTQRARWIHAPDERPDRRGQTLATRSAEVIRAWADARDARPVAATTGEDGRPRTLRMRFGDEAGGRNGRLREISWDEWLGVFEERDLVFIYQEERRDGRQSNFFRLDNPTREDG